MPMLKPVERTISFTIPLGFSVMDTAQCLAMQNRMAFRQGYEYAYETLEIYGTDSAKDGEVNVFRLPNTWVTCNSWVKSYHIWKDQQDDALEEGSAESIVARYRDFKIYFNVGHLDGNFDGTTVTQLYPDGFLSEAGAQAIDADAAMEWDYAQFVIPNYGGAAGTTVEADVFMLGPDVGSNYGLIHNYALSRSRPHPLDPSRVSEASPTIPDGGLFMEMQDVGENLVEVIDNASLKNQAAPYVIGGTDSEFEFYPWGANQPAGAVQPEFGVRQDKLIVRSGSTIATDQTGPFTALCGLLFFQNGADQILSASLKVAPGPYKGVMARPMQEVN